MADVFVVMENPDDGGGYPSRTWRPVAVYENEAAADADAHLRKVRPPGATFWIPPANVAVVKTPYFAELPAAFSTDAAAQQNLNTEWSVILDTMRRTRNPSQLRRRALRWLLVSVLGTPERFHTDTVFHAQVTHIEQMADVLVNIEQQQIDEVKKL